MPQPIHCKVTINPHANPIHWQDVTIPACVPLSQFRQLISAPFLDVSDDADYILHNTQTPIETEEQLQVLLNSTELLYIVIQRKFEDAITPRGDDSAMETVPIQGDFVIGQYTRRVLEHFSVSYQHVTCASDLVVILPLPKLMVETQLNFAPKKPFFLHMRVRKIAAWCEVPFEALLAELNELFETCRRERASRIAVPTEVAENPNYHHAACNNCEKHICGVRYKCVLCFDYDLCQDCEAENMAQPFHDPDHFFIKIHKPGIFSWKTIWLHRTQHLPPGAFSALRGFCTPKVAGPQAPTPPRQPTIPELERQIQMLQNQLTQIRRPQLQSGSPAQQGGFFSGVKNFFSPAPPSSPRE